MSGAGVSGLAAWAQRHRWLTGITVLAMLTVSAPATAAVGAPQAAAPAPATAAATPAPSPPASAPATPSPPPPTPVPPPLASPAAPTPKQSAAPTPTPAPATPKAVTSPASPSTGGQVSAAADPPGCASYGTAYEVCGAIKGKYDSLGGPAGFLGVPITNETTTPDGIGRFNHFATDGSIYWTPTTGAWSVHGQIRAHWQALGWEAGILGYPVTDETTTPDGIGRYNHFSKIGGPANGSIYWTPTTGAWSVQGGIRGRWAVTGWELGPLGYPTTDEHAGTTPYRSAGDRQNDFVHGSIYYNHANGVSNVQAKPETLVGEGTAFQFDSHRLDDALSAKVNLGSGNLELAAPGLSVPAIGADRPVGVTYNSLYGAPGAAAAGSSLIGPGWRLTDSPDLQLDTNPNGSITLVGGSGNSATFTGSCAAGLTHPAGLDATLTCAGGAYQLSWHQSGEEWDFTANGWLSAIKNRNSFPTVTMDRTGPNGLPATLTGSRGSTTAAALHLTYGGPGGKLDHLCRAATAGACTANPTPSDTTLVTTLGYDAGGHLARLTEPDGRITTFTYTGADLTTITVLERDGVSAHLVTTVAYDSLHRVTGLSVDPGGVAAVTSYDYSSTDGHTFLYDADHARPAGDIGIGTFTDYTIDAAARVSGTRDGRGNTTATGYTPNGGVATSTGATGGQSVNTYGANGGESLTKTQSSTGAAGTASYANTGGNTKYLPDSTTDPAGNTSTYVYNGAGNRTATTNATAATAAVGYNAEGTVASSTDPLNPGNPTTYGYAAATHQLTTITPPTGSSLAARSLSYDTLGRTRTEVTGTGVTRTYSYDRTSRLTRIDYSDGTASVVSGYDVAGNLTSRTDATGAGTTTYRYDRANRKTSQTAGTGATGCPGTGSATDRCYGYDPVGNLTSMRDGRGVTAYHYDPKLADLLDSATDSAGKVSIFGYNAAHQRSDSYYHTTGTNGAAATYDANGHLLAPVGFALHTVVSFDPSGRQTRIRSTRASSDADANRVADTSSCYSPHVTGQACPTSSAATDTAKRQWSVDTITGVITTYSYDPAGRLHTVATAGGATYSYCYDANGNRRATGSTDLNCATAASTATFNSANQRADLWYIYDGEGNLTSSPTMDDLDYNGANQTTAMAPAGDSEQALSYAGADQTIRTAAGDVSYQNATMGEVAQSGGGFDLLIDRDPAGTLLAVEDPGSRTAYYPVADPTGSVIYLVRDDGVTAAANTYDPYGVYLTATDAGSGDDFYNRNPIKFAGGYKDNGGFNGVSTSYYHFGQRYYDPATGSWTQQDSVTSLGDPTTGNRYAYAGDDPVNNTDPSGTEVTPGGGYDPSAGFYGNTGARLFPGEGRCYRQGTIWGIAGGITGGALGALAGGTAGCVGSIVN